MVVFLRYISLPPPPVTAFAQTPFRFIEILFWNLKPSIDIFFSTCSLFFKKKKINEHVKILIVWFEIEPDKQKRIDRVKRSPSRI